MFRFFSPQENKFFSQFLKFWQENTTQKRNSISSRFIRDPSNTLKQFFSPLKFAIESSPFFKFHKTHTLACGGGDQNRSTLFSSAATASSSTHTLPSSLFVMMAALLVQIARRTAAQQIANRTAIAEAIRSFGASSSCNGKTKQQKTKPRGFRAATATTGKRIDSVAESLASKGFLRSRSAYEPPENVSGQVNGIFDSLKIPSTRGFALRTLEEKFTVLTACSVAFNHSVPNSQLYEIKTIDDIVEFYETPVDTTTPFEAMKRIELPENLHIQHEYLRFNPETDTRFGGKTAFPKSSTLVTGLKYRNKYPGHIAKRSWP